MTQSIGWRSAAKRVQTASSGRRRREAIVAAAAILPAVLLIVGFFGVPAVQALVLSLSRWNGVGDPTLVGTDNYASVLTDPVFFASLGRTLIYATLTSLGITVIATFLAAAVSAGVKGSRFYRVIWFAPAVAPAAAVGVFWSTAFQPRIGTVNAILGGLGLGNDHTWLARTDTALLVLVFVSIWGGVGFAFLLLLGGMEQIPLSVYEAARIDGASRLRQFFSITLPLVRPVLAITATLQLIWAFNGFTLVWGLTKGGPADATSTLPVLVYKEGFQFFRFGEASTVAVLAGAVLIVIGFFAMRLSQSQQEEK
jgi:ABC-type sugar transport system permease subunit